MIHKTKSDLLGFAKIKNFCSLESQATEKENIFIKYISDKGIVSEIDKQHSQPKEKKAVKKNGQTFE